MSNPFQVAGRGAHLHVVADLVSAGIRQQAAGNGGAGHAGHHEAGEDEAVLQVLPIGAQRGRPQEHKCVHARLKQRLHRSQQCYLGVCKAKEKCCAVYRRTPHICDKC